MLAVVNNLQLYLSKMIKLNQVEKDYLVNMFNLLEKKSKIVIDNTRQAENVAELLKNLARSSAEARKTMTTNAVKTPRGALVVAAKTGSAAI